MPPSLRNSSDLKSLHEHGIRKKTLQHDVYPSMTCFLNDYPDDRACSYRSSPSCDRIVRRGFRTVAHPTAAPTASPTPTSAPTDSPTAESTAGPTPAPATTDAPPERVGTACSDAEPGSEAAARCEAAGNPGDGRYIVISREVRGRKSSSLSVLERLHLDPELRLPEHKIRMLWWMLNASDSNTVGSAVDRIGIVVTPGAAGAVSNAQLSLFLNDPTKFTEVLAAIFGVDLNGFADSFDPDALVDSLFGDSGYGAVVKKLLLVAEEPIDELLSMLTAAATELVDALSPSISRVDLLLVWRLPPASTEDVLDILIRCEGYVPGGAPFVELVYADEFDFPEELTWEVFYDRIESSGQRHRRTEACTGLDDADGEETAGFCQYWNATGNTCSSCPESSWQYDASNKAGIESCKAVDCNARSSSAPDDRTWWEKFPLKQTADGVCATELTGFEKMIDDVTKVLTWVMEGLTDGFSFKVGAGSARFEVTLKLWSTVQLIWSPAGNNLSETLVTLSKFVPTIDFVFNPYYGLGTDQSYVGKYDVMQPGLKDWYRHFDLHQRGLSMGQKLLSLWPITKTSYQRTALDVRFSWPNLADLWDDEDAESDVFEMELSAAVNVRNIFGGSNEATPIPNSACATFCSGLENFEIWNQAFPEDGLVDYHRSFCKHFDSLHSDTKTDKLLAPVKKKYMQYCYKYRTMKSLGFAGWYGLGNRLKKLKVFGVDLEKGKPIVKFTAAELDRAKRRYALWKSKATDVDRMRACAMMVAFQQGHAVNAIPERMWYHSRPPDWYSKERKEVPEDIWTSVFANRLPPVGLGTRSPSHNTLKGWTEDESSTYYEWNGALSSDLAWKQTYTPKKLPTADQSCDEEPSEDETESSNGQPIATLEACTDAASKLSESISVSPLGVGGRHGCSVDTDGVLHFNSEDDANNAALTTTACQQAGSTSSQCTAMTYNDLGDRVEGYLAPAGVTLTHVACKFAANKCVAKVDLEGKTALSICNEKDAIPDAKRWWTTDQMKVAMCSMPMYRRATYCRSFGSQTECEGDEVVGCSWIEPSWVEGLQEYLFLSQDTGCIIQNEVLEHCQEHWNSPESLAQSMPERYESILASQLDADSVFKNHARPVSRLFKYAELPKTDKCSTELNDPLS